MAAIRVLIRDDQLAFADAVGAVIEAQADMTIGGMGSSNVDVAIVADDYGGALTVEAVDSVCQSNPAVRVVVLSADPDVTLALAAVRAGASALVRRDDPIERLLDAVRWAATGGSWIPPDLLSGVLARLQASYDENPLSRLTQRELEVLECMIAGLDRRAVAEECCMSVNTARTHMRNIFRKLEVHSSIEAVSVALQHGRGLAGIPSTGRGRTYGVGENHPVSGFAGSGDLAR